MAKSQRQRNADRKAKAMADLIRTGDAVAARMMTPERIKSELAQIAVDKSNPAMARIRALELLLSGIGATASQGADPDSIKAIMGNYMEGAGEGESREGEARVLRRA